MPAKADLHVHSKYSDKPDIWLLHKIGSPECFTEPRFVYDACRDAGMDFVTLSDHNTIDGALEIAHLPGTFLSSEITVTFPEDGCEIHCLVLGISETQFAEIDRRRDDIYAFRDYLYEQNILHSVAHPLYRVNDRLTVEHFEKLLLLFKRFEGINGARHARAAELARAIIYDLTPADIDDLSRRHGIQPLDRKPWIKLWTGGSDDHSGLGIGKAFTVTPDAADVQEYLGHLAAGRHCADGTHGDSLQLARSFSKIARQYYLERWRQRDDNDLFADVLESLLAGDAPPAWKRRRAWLSTASAFAPPGSALRRKADLAAGIDQVVFAAAAETPDSVRRGFDIAAGLSQRWLCETLGRMVAQLTEGKIGEVLDSTSKLMPAVLAAAPYLFAVHTQHKDEQALQQIAADFDTEPELRRVGDGKAWFTDTLTEVNGVARTVRTFAALAQARGKQLDVITSQRRELPGGLEVCNFPPESEFDLPAYEHQKLSFPPFLEILEHCERQRLCEVLISTPGPVGLTGLLAGKMLGIRLTGFYHTDLPAYVQHLTGSQMLQGWAWHYVRWFYQQMDVVYVPSKGYLERLVENGFHPEHLRLMPRGVDREQFHPAHRDTAYWGRQGLPEGLRFLYVGRVSREKNLDALLQAFVSLREQGHAATLSIVGDGPYLEELKERHGRPDVAFTGYLQGQELATAYASADVFVFPSTTDTFGNAVLEAHACGLPAVVSDKGGPCEIVRPHGSGLVVDIQDTTRFTQSLIQMLRSPELRTEMSPRALRAAEDHTWETLLHQLWPDDEMSFPSRRSLSTAA